MLYELILIVALQLPDYDKRVEELRRMSEMANQSEIRLAQQRDMKYRKAVLHRDHEEFVIKFNDYLAKYNQGAMATREIRDCVRAWEKLRKNPDSGFNAGH